MFYSNVFSHIVAYLNSCVTPAYLEPCYIQNPGIFRTQDISEICQAYSGIFTTLCNARILRTLPYSEFWHI